MSGDPFWQSIRDLGLSVPGPILSFHEGEASRSFTGKCDIERGANPLIRLGLWLAGYPRAGTDVPVRVTLEAFADHTIWSRDFGGHITRSTLTYDATGFQIVERLGAFELIMQLCAEQNALHLDIHKMRVIGVPIPRFLLPKSRTREFADEQGRFCFDVAADFPGLGQIIRYRGWLVRDQADTSV